MKYNLQRLPLAIRNSHAGCSSLHLLPSLRRRHRCSPAVPVTSTHGTELTSPSQSNFNTTTLLEHVEFGVHIFEHVAGVRATRTEVAIMCVTMMDSIEFVEGSIDGLVRYSRVCCTQVLSHEFPMMGPPTLLVLTFRQAWVDGDVLWEVMVNSFLLRGDELL